jgi:Tfp pilus assembly protein FimT
MIEIMLVLVIIAMAATLVGPAIDSGLRAREVRSAARTIAGTMRSLQGDAIRTGKMQSLLIDPMDNQIAVASGHEAVELGRAAQIQQMVGGERRPNGVVQVNFYPNGSSTGISVLVGERGGPPRDGFIINADPIIGLVTIRDAHSR